MDRSYPSILRLWLLLGVVFLSYLVQAQCPTLYNGAGDPDPAPYWYNCSGANYTLLVQSPDNIGNWTIDWGDGSPMESGASLVSPQNIPHVYTANVDTFVVTFTEVNTGCIISGVMVMEESSSASIQIPIGGLTQACAPQDMDFINSSTNVSENTTFIWDFGDGTTPEVYDHTNWGQTITHTYEQGTVSCETVVTLSAENYCNTLQGGASTATFNPIRVWDLDTAQITASATLLCYPDTTVTFLNTSIRNCLNQGNIYQRFEYWNFGNYWGQGQDSTIDWTPWPPTFPHTIGFPGVGTYEVMLQDSNFCGIDTTTIIIQIVPPPSVTLTAIDTVCVGEPVTFNQTTNGGANYYEWDFDEGNGFQWTGAGDQTNAYDNPGDYTISYAVSVQGATAGCADTASVDLHVLPSPTAAIVADQVAACDSITVNFSDGSIDALSWNWDFDNGNTSMAQNPPTQSYNTPGQYDVTLTVINANMCQHTATQPINVFESPIVDFTGSNVCEGEPAQFTDNSILSPGDVVQEWNWDFGDGSIDSIQNPIHTYASSGTFWVTLEVVGIMCSAIDSIQVTTEQAPTAAITPSAVLGCTPFEVDFSNTSTGGVTYEWDFADGNTSVLFEPTHTFVNMGSVDTTYSVSMVVSTTFGCTDTAWVDITVTPEVVADFDHDAVAGCAPVAVDFLNTSSGAVSYEWDFGDGNTSTDSDPSNIYVNNTGFIETYDVTLVATSALGCTDTTMQQITVYPMADFTFTSSPDIGCSPLQVTLPALPGAVDYQWAFGDGTFGSGPSPTHVFLNNTNTPQHFNIQLIAMNAFGCIDTTYASVLVLPDPTADFNMDVVAGCHPLEVDFTDLSDGATIYNWNYGDGQTSDTTVAAHQHTFYNYGNAPTSFNVSLIVESPNGCRDTTEQIVEVYPEVSAQAFGNNLGCSPHTVDFDNQTLGAQNYFWDFGDGVTSADSEPIHTFLNTSPSDTIFNVMLVATSTFGCTDTIYLPITVNPMPTAQFTMNATAGCQPMVLGLDNYSLGATNYYWNYGDGTFSTNGDPYHEHTYVNNTGIPQDFEVQLIAYTAGGCTDTTVQNVTIFPDVVAAFSSDTAACGQLSVELANNSQGAVSYIWMMGDGNTLMDVEPTYNYVNTGNTDLTYTMTLVATSAFGCTDTAYQTVHVYAVPTANFIATPFIQQFPNATVDLLNMSSAGNWNYDWDMADGTTSQDQDPTPHTYGSWGVYDVELVVSSAFCSDTAVQQITIEPPVPTASFLGSGEGCAPLTVPFTNTSLAGVDYSWNFGDGGTSIAEHPTYTFNDPGVYTISLTVTGIGGGTQTAVHIDSVIVHPKANAYFVLNPNNVIVPSDPVYFYNLSGFADQYLWDFGDGEHSAEINPTHYYQEPGMFDVTLIANNQWNCPDTFSLPEAVLAEASGGIEFPNAFTPSNTGPGDGRFDPLSQTNEIFFPLYEGVEDYQLLIFNRWGELIFESRDVTIGWDGYYRGQPAKQDVYVWKCNAKFSDGSAFSDAGDLTLLR